MQILHLRCSLLQGDSWYQDGMPSLDCCMFLVFAYCLCLVGKVRTRRTVRKHVSLTFGVVGVCPAANIGHVLVLCGLVPDVASLAEAHGI